MNRTINLPNHYGAEDRFVLKEEYGGLGIYQRKTPRGFLVYQHYLITNGNFTVEFPSYSNMFIEDMYDFIDEYNRRGTISTKLIMQSPHRYVQHSIGGDYINKIA